AKTSQNVYDFSRWSMEATCMFDRQNSEWPCAFRRYNRSTVPGIATNADGTWRRNSVTCASDKPVRFAARTMASWRGGVPRSSASQSACPMICVRTLAWTIGSVNTLAMTTSGSHVTTTPPRSNTMFKMTLSGARATLELAPGRHAYVQVATGAVDLDGQRLEAGDGVAISDQQALTIAG